MALEEKKDTVKLVTGLAVGYGVSKVVSDAVDAVAVIESARDRMRVKIGGFAIGMYISSKVRSYVDDGIDEIFDGIEKVRELWNESAEENGNSAKADAETTAEEIPVEEPAAQKG